MPATHTGFVSRFDTPRLSEAGRTYLHWHSPPLSFVGTDCTKQPTGFEQRTLDFSFYTAGLGFCHAFVTQLRQVAPMAPDLYA